MIVSYTILTGAMAVLVYLVKRYINNQDRRYIELSRNFEELTNKFIQSVDELKELISELKTSAVSHRAICDERHGGMKARVERLEEDFKNVRLFNSRNNG